MHPVDNLRHVGRRPSSLATAQQGAALPANPHHGVRLVQCCGYRFFTRDHSDSFLGAGNHGGEIVGHRNDDGNDVGDLSSEQFVYGVVDCLDAVAIGEGLPAIAGAIHQGDDFAIRVLSVGVQVVASPGPCPANHSDSVFFIVQDWLLSDEIF